MKEIFSSIEAYLRDVFKLSLEENFAKKVADSLFAMLVDGYIERLIMAINQRFKLKLPLEHVLLEFIYHDSLVPKKDKKNKIIKKKFLIDFYVKGSD